MRSSKSNNHQHLKNKKSNQNDLITKAQIGLLHVAKQQLGFNDELYHDILDSIAGVSSSTQVPKDKFDELLSHFKSHGFEMKKKIPLKTKKKYDELSGRAGMATPAQLRYIEVMFSEWLKFRHPEEDIKTMISAALRHFLKNKFGVEGVRFVTLGTASKAIEGLKNALTREKMKAKGTSQPQNQNAANDNDNINMGINTEINNEPKGPVKVW